jgi:chromosome segregation ATPase
MSEDLPTPPSPDEGRLIKPLGAASTRIEGVEGEAYDVLHPGDTAVFEPLNAASTRTEEVHVGETPLVVMDDPDQLDTESGELTVPELVGEVKRLRSQFQIVRTERTAIAGRKYALDVVIESLREKVEQAEELISGIDDQGPFGDLIRSLQLILGDARRIADTKAVLEKDLEEERRRHLDERQAFEQRSYALEETLTGLRSERNSLRTTVARLESDRLDWMEKLADAHDSLSDRDLALSEVEGQASERLEAYAERMQAMEAEVERLRVEAESNLAANKELEGALDEAVQHSERATQRLGALEPELEEAGEGLRASEARVAEAEIAAERDREQITRLKSELEAARNDTTQLEEVRAETEAVVVDRDRLLVRERELEMKSEELAAARERGEHAIGALRQELAQARAEASSARDSLETSNTRIAASTTRLQALEDRASSEADELKELRRRVKELEVTLGEQTATLGEQRKALIDVKPMLEDWTRLDRECQRLARLVGQARDRGRVNVAELMARESLLRRLEKLTE